VRGDRSGGDGGADAARPSRSERKREHQVLQRLAAAALAAPAARLARLGLDEEIRDALRAGRAMKASTARARHVRHLANLLEADPAAAAAIGAALEQDAHAHAAEVARFHLVERWRDRLLAEGDAGLGEFLADYPGADVTALRSLLRQAAKDAGTPRQAATARRLHRVLQQGVASAAASS
jgi:ribosome-associated protein